MRVTRLSPEELAARRRSDTFLAALMRETDALIASVAQPLPIDWREVIAHEKADEAAGAVRRAVDSVEVQERLRAAVLGGIGLAVWAMRRREAKFVSSCAVMEFEERETVTTIAKTVLYLQRWLGLTEAEAEGLRLALLQFESLVVAVGNEMARVLVDKVLARLPDVIRSGARAEEVIAGIVESLQKSSSVITRDLVTSAVDSAYSQHLGEIAARERVFLRYVTERDTRVRPQHRAMDSFTALASDPIWQIWEPLNGWGCRCKLIPLSGVALLRPAAGSRPFGDPPRFVRAIERDEQYGYAPGVLIPVYPDVGFDVPDWSARIRSYRGATKDEEYARFLSRRDRYIASLDNRRVA